MNKPFYITVVGVLAFFCIKAQPQKALPHSRHELETASGYFQMESYYGEEATETALKTRARSHGILHLATHSVVDDENPLNSKLLLGKGDDDDGILHTHEIYGLDLKTRMAVLSACNSGVGKQQNGEGVMSLAHAFAFAGCPTIVMSLWPVDDRATSSLIASFYQKLAEEKPVDKAMQEAKLEYLASHTKQQAAPFYWAAFNTWGNVKPLQVSAQPKTISLRWWILGGVGILLLWLVFLRLRRKG